MDNLKIYMAKEPEFLMHTVIKGDTLWKLAVRYLGSGLRFPEIKKQNGLNSNVIYPGQKLMIRK